MDKALQVVLDMIGSPGVQIEYVELPPDRDGEYIHEERLIRIQHDLSHRPMRSTIANECAHAVFGDERGTIISGHVGEGCIVDPTAEIHITVFEGEIGRRPDPRTGLWILDI